MKIATLNINSINARLENFSNWVQKHQFDIILLQETKCQNINFPKTVIEQLDYKYQAIHGQKSYNGVAILSKQELKEINTTFLNNTHEEDSRYLEVRAQTSIGEVIIICIYVPNGAPMDSKKYHKKLEFLDKFIIHLKNLSNLEKKILIGGDLNVAPYDIDVYDPKNLQNTVAFTMPEKERLREILNLGFIDCYRILHPNAQTFSWFDYRHQGLQNNHGFRIDFLLANDIMIDHLVSCEIDLALRASEKPSDHAPVTAHFGALS